jgi:ubiquitin C-terminal hydrolase
VSRKPYLANGSQQDMDEFLTTVLTVLEQEVTDDDGLFSPTIQQFWGKEMIVRKFFHTQNGKCEGCHLFPSSNEQNFLSLKFEVPDVTANIELASLVYNYFSESVDQMQLRCGNCCRHASNCPQTGPCRPRAAVTQTVLTESPTFLLIQLKRFGSNSNEKISTNVLPNTYLQLPNLDTFELLTVTSHIGTYTNSGHYVSFIKTGNGWTLCDDARNCAVTESSVKNKDNYVFVYKKVSLPDYPPRSLFGEYATWHPVSGINQIYAELNSGLN